MIFNKIYMIVMFIILVISNNTLHSSDKILFYKSSISELSNDGKIYIEKIQNMKFVEKIYFIELSEINFKETYIVELEDSIEVTGSFEKEENFVKFKTNNIEIYGTFLYKNKTLRGYFNVNNKIYELKPIEEKLHILFSINKAEIRDEDCSLNTFEIIEKSEKKEKSNNKLLSTLIECHTNILVAYTPEAYDVRGGVSDINDDIKLAVQLANESYENSQINQRVNLVRTVLTNYMESHTTQVAYLKYHGNQQFPTDLIRLQNKNDGYMDELHSLREIYSADMVVLIVGNSGFAGVGRVIYAEAKEEAFCMVEANGTYLTSNYTFAHELGHLMGARHDYGAHNNYYNIPFAYGHGFCYSPGSWRTIMSYNSCGASRINYWSNPNVTYGGVAMGTTSREDNARVLDETEIEMKNLVVTPTNYYMTDDNIVDEYDIADLVAFEKLDVESTYIIEPNAEVTFRAGNEIRIGPGFQAKSGSEFHAFIDNVNCSSSSKQSFENSENVINYSDKLTLSPNPTSGKALATVEIGERSICSLVLLDNLGKEVIVIFKDKELSPGTYQYDLESDNLSSGVYLCVLRIGNSLHSEKLVYLK